MIQLSKRLQRVSDYITKGAVVADIGSDHAMLPVYLVQSGKCSKVIAGELNKGPFQAAKRQIEAAGLQNQVYPRQGNGLEVLVPHEADTVTIAGMGGALMSEILEAGLKAGKLAGVQHLVLQPNVGEDFVRRWIIRNGWSLLDESILEEDGKIYEILYASKNVPVDSKPNHLLFTENPLELPFARELKEMIVYKMGPYLLKKKDPVLTKKWMLEIEKLQYVAQSIEKSNHASSLEKLAATKNEMKLIQEVLQWLSTDTPSYN